MVTGRSLMIDIGAMRFRRWMAWKKRNPLEDRLLARVVISRLMEARMNTSTGCKATLCLHRYNLIIS